MGPKDMARSEASCHRQDHSQRGEFTTRRSRQAGGRSGCSGDGEVKRTGVLLVELDEDGGGARHDLRQGQRWLSGSAVAGVSPKPCLAEGSPALPLALRALAHLIERQVVQHDDALRSGGQWQGKGEGEAEGGHLAW